MSDTTSTVHDLTSQSRVGRRERVITATGATGASRAFAWLLIVTGALGSLASFVITVDKFELLVNPRFSPSCNLSPVLSCSNVMLSDQASVFGFPNPLIGLLAYPVVVAAGFALLAGARFRR
ncbi:hypothetical protein GCM10010121_001400 [Streptomyces brasiliensis]|uniref:Vitamin K epoxide reductase domain-containing protein n=1 Tax=Streptomyces brasiliensis TaxID=1954 RepID=A0A917NF22_9ACTN|nr:hypothetical protein GCM10010121_001400 [Streptomyces brasiliensis]